MICWYCYWGWSKPVHDIYVDAINKLGSNGEHIMAYGPAHTVWANENFDKDSIKWCIDNSQKYRNDLTDEQLAIVVDSLHKLYQLPDDVVDPEPENYGDDCKPEDYPPAKDIVMVNYLW